jgi:hypothetical protein
MHPFITTGERERPALYHLNVLRSKNYCGSPSERLGTNSTVLLDKSIRGSLLDCEIQNY